MTGSISDTDVLDAQGQIRSTSDGRNSKLFGNIEDNSRAPPKHLYNVQDIRSTEKTWGRLERCEGVHTGSGLYMVDI